MAQSIPVIEGSLKSPRVRIIATDRPWQWLAAGWRDTLKTPMASIFYGVIFAAMGYFLTNQVVDEFHLALALCTGFLLVGPFLATGLYDLSRRLEEGEPASLGASLFAWRNNVMGILLFGIAVGLIMIVWARLSALLFAVIFLESTPTVSSNVTTIFFSGSGLQFLIVFTIVGAVLASLVFAISVVSIPMLLDRQIDIVTAVVTSVTAVKANLGTMLLWAALIVIFTGVGIVTFFLGLIITMPLIGHATWYAYRDLVELDKE
jgi:uncharacterized membrane protein